VLITFKSSEANKQVRPGSIEAFCYASLVAIANVKHCTLSFSRFAPHHGRLFRPLIPIIISVTTVRRRDVALPSISATVFTTPKPHGLTIVELRVAYTRYLMGQLTVTAPQRLQMEPFTRNRRYKSSISIRARQYHCSCSSSS
jgi:hypothetical protein